MGVMSPHPPRVPPAHTVSFRPRGYETSLLSSLSCRCGADRGLQGFPGSPPDPPEAKWIQTPLSDSTLRMWVRQGLDHSLYSQGFFFFPKGDFSFNSSAGKSPEVMGGKKFNLGNYISKNIFFWRSPRS